LNRFLRSFFFTKSGQLPVIEIDGKQYAQSNGILHYAGKLSGLYPTDPILALQVSLR
jgi:glutathione S-transferase